MINVPFSSLTDEWERHLALWMLNLLHLDYLKEINVYIYILLFFFGGGGGGDVFVAFWRRFLYPFSLPLSVFLSVSASVCQSVCLFASL